MHVWGRRQIALVLGNLVLNNNATKAAFAVIEKKC
jgi:hypothetical protein